MRLRKGRAESKAWKYLRKVLNDDEKYFTLKTARKPIELEGKKGDKYFLYPSGKIARIDADEPRLGMLHPPKGFPLADFMATLVIWIRHRESDLKKVWRCGNLAMSYNGEIEELARQNYMQRIENFDELIAGNNYGATGFWHT